MRIGFRLAAEASFGGTIVVLGLSGVVAIVAPITVLVSKRLIDQIATAATLGLPTTDLVRTALVLGGLTSLRGLGSVAANQQAVLARTVTHKTEQRFLGAVSQADMAYLDDPSWYDRVSNAGDELASRPGSLVSDLVQLVSSTISVVGLAGVLVSLHPILLGLSVVAATPALLAQRYVTRAMYGLRREFVAGHREKTYLADLLSKPFAAKELRAFGLAPTFLKRRDDAEAPLRARFGRVVGRTHLAMLGGALVWGGAYTTAYLFVALRGASGALSVGTLAAVTGAFGLVSGALATLVGSLGQLDRQSLLFLEDYYQLLELPALVDEPAEPRSLPETLQEGLAIKNVSFTYPGSDHPALDDVSLALEPGQLLAIVGENGAGKTTLVKLLLRFYLPDEGSISVGGVDLRELDSRQLRDRVGVLFQDFVPYEFTVRENVVLGRARDGHDQGRLVEAIEDAEAKNVVDGLSGGLDSRIGRMFQGGHDLSGGQWQRLALARLFYRDADIWVLDEPTSALDPEAEAAIFGRLRQQLGDRIGIIISHRFSTVRIADEIAVMGSGRICELGTHDELLRRGGRYAELFELQASGYR